MGFSNVFFVQLFFYGYSFYRLVRWLASSVWVNIEYIAPQECVGWRRMRDYCGRAKSATPRANCAGKDMNLQNGGSA